MTMLRSVVIPVLVVNTAKMKPIPRIELHKNVNVIKIDLTLKNATPY